MVYDSLLLNYGGGIIGDFAKSAQSTDTATLAIGLGGIGVAALSTLKSKIYRQLHPDNRGDAVPCYDGIQLLGIDSDDADYKKYRGNFRLRPDEFFSLFNPNLHAALRNKKLIKDDPRLNWMEIDNFSLLMSPGYPGTDGIRQIGRYLLLSKAASLEAVIQDKCMTAIQERGSHNLDIHIFAGISGGTGSGCFLDTCYMVRQIALNNGWNARITGYFFLPDVVTSKPEVAKNPGSVAYNNANGYAALKELDYLFSLRDANDWFSQNYSSTLRVHTQEPPVDMCFLLSARQSDGTAMPNGFSHCLNVATDYVMSYLTVVQLDGGGDDANNSMTMRGHLVSIARGITSLPYYRGVNRSYHIMGACSAEIPMRQINTYLACGFYAKFLKEVGRDTFTVGRSEVVSFTKDMKLLADDIYNSLIMNAPMLMLPEIDRRVLRRSGRPAPGCLPEEWAITANNWYDRCEAELTANAKGLSMTLDSFAYSRININSLIGRVFRKLWEMSVNPEIGPYYAAQLLHNGSYDLITEIEGAIETAEQRKNTEIMYFRDSDMYIEQAKDKIYGSQISSLFFSKNVYAQYENACVRRYGHMFTVSVHAKCAEVLRSFKKQVQELYNNYFKTLVELLDNLKETFRENQTYLELPASTADSNHTWQILPFQDVKKTLDERIATLSPKKMVTDFVTSLLQNHESWITGDPDKIAKQIREQMLELFQAESDRSLQDYLKEKYPQARDFQSLADAVREDIIDRVHSFAVPIFWKDPTFHGATFDSCNMNVPASATAVCTAAIDFCSLNHFPYYLVRQTGIYDRIFALRLCSGLPLYAYQGITELKSYYDRAEGTAAGYGIHLYAFTGRGDPKTDGTGHKDWRHFLPDPIP